MKYRKIVKSFYGIVIVQEEDKYLNKFIILKLSKHNNSVGKTSTCSAGNCSLIPVSGRSTGEEIGYPLQFSWAFFVAQLVKKPSAMRETWV